MNAFGLLVLGEFCCHMSEATKEASKIPLLLLKGGLLDLLTDDLAIGFIDPLLLLLVAGGCGGETFEVRGHGEWIGHEEQICHDLSVLKQVGSQRHECRVFAGS